MRITLQFLRNVPGLIEIKMLGMYYYLKQIINYDLFEMGRTNDWCQHVHATIQISSFDVKISLKCKKLFK